MKNNKENSEIKIKYFLYARKSSESEDRQIQSIEDQISRLKKLAISLGIIIKEKDILTESKSAKKPNNRPIFDEMLNRIEKGEAQGILSWQLNRLSRNPVDSGRIGWMLQQGILKSIQTIDKEYKPEDNVLLFSVESGMANQFIIDLKKTSRRGMEGKAERGWLPSRAPIGYLNDKLNHTIIEDPERFSLVRKMWDMMLTGAYTPTKILEIITKEWRFKTPKWNRSGDKELAKSGIYNMFSNIFYTGNFNWGGEHYKGIHKPMITEDEFDRVQRLLGKSGKPRFGKHLHLYTGIIRCSECGCLHTACTKVKTLISTGEQKLYDYYYCTRKKKSIKCSQKKALTEKNLENQIGKILENSEINPIFLQWALDYLNTRNDKEVEDRTKIYQSQQNSYNKLQRELDNLTRMFYKELIEEEYFIKESEELKQKIKESKLILEKTEDRALKWLEFTKKTFQFATYARKHFFAPETTPEQKKEIMLGLGWNWTIKDQILNISKYKWMEKLENGYKPLKNKYERLELEKTLTEKERNTKIEGIRTEWGGYRELNPN